MSTNLTRIAKLARGDRKRQFTSIAHQLTPGLLGYAFVCLRKEAGAGVDGVTYAEYEEGFGERIRDLHDRVKSGRYRAQPLRRIYIPKDDGRKRAISIPVPEDKIVQRAAVELLNAIYEQDFLDCSYGFRPRRSAQDALDEVGKVICRCPISYVLEADTSLSEHRLPGRRNCHRDRESHSDKDKIPEMPPSVAALSRDRSGVR